MPSGSLGHPQNASRKRHPQNNVSTFAIISDLHSNLEAVEAVFARIDELGVDEVVCLGDVVGYGADPLPVTMMVMKRCKWTIMGNHDWGMFYGMGDFNPLAREALLFTQKQLKPFLLRPSRRQAHEFLKGLPKKMSDFGYDFYHGSPRDPVMEYVLKSDGFLEPEKMAQLFQHVSGPCFVGHTHWPGVHRPDFRFTQATDEACEFELDGPCIVNVGSVGQPRDGDPRASFAVVRDGTARIERVPYDFRRTQAKILAAGLHPALAERLARGK